MSNSTHLTTVLICVSLLILSIESHETKKETYYEILNIEQTSGLPVIKKAFFTLSKLYHPDKTAPKDKEKNREIYDKIQHAYAVLSDENKRMQYDRLLAMGETEYDDESIRRDEQRKQAQKKFHEEMEKTRKKQRETAEYFDWWSSALSAAFFIVLVTWGTMQVIAQYKAKKKAAEKEAARKEEAIAVIKTRQQILEEKREKKRQMTAQLIKEEQERQKLWEEKVKSSPKEEELYESLNFEIDENKISDFEESVESLENYKAIEQEQIKEAEIEKKVLNLYCVACRKKFKSLNSWDNHTSSKKHKTGLKNLQGDKLDEYHEKAREIEFLLAEQAQDSLSEEESM
eukprot:TRINITY_DN6066_c0_g1_i1.p1 TRINITY_DN6066_c0_g1~~TRINITY_DN6066_c0_g1_i1.p1  ORF type:complete len:351 (-),score=104.28 TRINITY_DN6066_c0_g1_i1:30-1061(-)